MTKTRTAQTALCPLLAAPLFALLAFAGSAEAASRSTLHHGPSTCVSGYVWREAAPGDLVCVTPQTRAQAAHDNRQAGYRRDVFGAYGSASCKQGYVWREAFESDLVCVTPDVRAQAKRDNAYAPYRVAR